MRTDNTPKKYTWKNRLLCLLLGHHYWLRSVHQQVMKLDRTCARCGHVTRGSNV